MEQDAEGLEILLHWFSLLPLAYSVKKEKKTAFAMIHNDRMCKALTTRSTGFQFYLVLKSSLIGGGASLADIRGVQFPLEPLLLKMINLKVRHCH